MSLKELIALVSLDVSESKLSKDWSMFDELQGYEIDSGYAVSKDDADNDFEAIKREESDRLSRANWRLAFSLRFAELCSRVGVKVISVSGSTSYLSVARDDDLDFFCIMNVDSLWPSLAKFLLLARVFRIVHEDSPLICLSYVADEAFALREFTSPQDGLFARDAIYVRVLRGRKYYARLLKSSTWMAGYFPRMYCERVKEAEGKITVKSSSAAGRIANLFVYLTVGRYIKIKSFLLNRRYAKERMQASLFRVRMGRDHCIYESTRYLDLKHMYSCMDDGERRVDE